MTIPHGSSLETRPSLLKRLQSDDDPQSWQEFYLQLGGEWDAAWERNLLTQAMERVRETIDERQFQIFDLYVTKGWPGGEVAKSMKASIALVYVTRFRVTALLKQEVRRLEKEAERALREM